jgi:hypothetical protein
MSFPERSRFLIKPAFSSCGWGAQYAGTMNEVIVLLSEMKARHALQTTYHRIAENFFGVLFIGDPQIIDLRERIRIFRQFLSQMQLEEFGRDMEALPDPDPFWIVQQVVFSSPLPLHGKHYFPTYRTFVLIEEQNSSVKISFLEKILETLNTLEQTRFFNAIFRNDRHLLLNLVRCYPELRPYHDAMVSYPPYQRMLSLNANVHLIWRYETYLAIYAIQRHMEESPNQRVCEVSRMAALIAYYESGLTKRVETSTATNAFISLIEKFYAQHHRQGASSRSLTQTDSRPHVFVKLGLLTMKISSLRSKFDIRTIPEILSLFESFKAALFVWKPIISQLFRTQNWRKKDYLLFFDLIQKKEIREILVRYTSLLCSLDLLIKERGGNVEASFLCQKQVFLFPIVGWNVVSELEQN